MILELLQSKHCYFVTLTYSDEAMPRTPTGAMTLSKEDLQRYWKRLRQSNPLVKFRYFAVGEYGDLRGRPHYHAMVYTDREVAIEWDLTTGRSLGGAFRESWHPDCRVDVAYIGATEDGIRTAQYTAGYVVKKLTSEKAVQEVYGDDRIPEFTVSSRRPGIGLGAVPSLAEALRTANLRRVDGHLEPGTGGDDAQWKQVYMVRVGNKKWPLDRRLREKLYAYAGADTRSDRARAGAENMRIVEGARVLDPAVEVAKDVDSYHRAEKKARQHKESRRRGETNRRG